MSASGWRTEPLPPNWESEIRPAILARDPLCTWPGGCAELSTDVDHLGAPGDHRAHLLRGLCGGHHAIVTAGQGGRAAGQQRAAIAAARYRPREQHPGLLEKE